MSTELVPVKGDLVTFNAEQIEVIRQTIAAGTTQAELDLFLAQCRRTGLDPLSRQIYCIVTGQGQYRRVQVTTSIDGFRVIAERSGVYSGQLGPFWCGEDGAWRDVWLQTEPPAAAKVGILRRDFTEPLWGVALWKECVQHDQQGRATGQWGKRGSHMLAKCAESLALRRALPNDLSGLYTSEEMDSVPQSEPRYAKPQPPVWQPAPANVDTSTGEVIDVTPEPEPPKPERTVRPTTRLFAALQEVGFATDKSPAAQAARRDLATRAIGRNVSSLSTLNDADVDVISAYLQDHPDGGADIPDDTHDPFADEIGTDEQTDTVSAPPWHYTAGCEAVRALSARYRPDAIVHPLGNTEERDRARDLLNRVRRYCAEVPQWSPTEVKDAFPSSWMWSDMSEGQYNVLLLMATEMYSAAGGA